MDGIEKLPFSREICKKLNDLVLLIIENVSTVEKIVLFGSYARAEYKFGSDLDIFILTSEQTPRATQANLRCAYDDVDFVFYTKEVFEKSEALLVRNIRKDGILLWKA